MTIVKLNPEFLIDPAVQKLLQIAHDASIELRFVGGCVRDAMMGRVVNDLDLATPSQPELIMQIYQAAGVKTLPTGISHGTVTALVGGKSFEITTLRRDVECDGRHAITEFVEDWQEDAKRRDFTMNALFMNQHGEIIDYVGGITDVQSGQLRFIGDARARIEEDYLRILRYFRFLASHATAPPLSAELQACANYAPQLCQISPERIAVEMRKLLGAKNPLFALQLMIKTKVWQQITTDSYANLTALAELLQRETDCNPWLRLSAILTNINDVNNIAQNWRLSGEIKKYLQILANAPKINSEYEVRLAVDAHGATLTADILTLHSYAQNLAKLRQYLREYNPKTMPINGNILLENGFYGAEIKRAMLACKQQWIATNQSLNAAQLLAIAAQSKIN